MDAKTEAFDPAAHGWETYADEGFIGHVGPFWMKKDVEGHLGLTHLVGLHKMAGDLVGL